METAQDFYQSALAALKTNDKAEAIQRLTEAVEAEDSFLEAWLKLAELLPDGQDKAEVIDKILELDPENSFAQDEQARLEAGFGTASKANLSLEKLTTFVNSFIQQDANSQSEIVPGITRGEARLVAIGLGIFTGFMCLLTFLVISLSGQGEAQRNAQATAQAMLPTQILLTDDANFTATAQSIVETSIAGTETAVLTITPSATWTRTPSVQLPTEIPATATATIAALRVLPLPPPELELSGRILAWGGVNPQSPDYLQVRIYNPLDGERAERSFSRVSDYLMNELSSDAIQSRIVGRLADSRQRDLLLVSINTQRLDNPPDVLNLTWGTTITDAQKPSLSLAGNQMVFIGKGESGIFQIFHFNFDDRTFKQITDDSDEYFSAALSSNGTQVVAVRRGINGQDLVLIDLRSEPYTQRNLTADGDTMLEDMPRFAPNDLSIVYAAANNLTRHNHDIYLINLENSQSEVRINSEADEIYPNFSPNSRFLAYSSNANGRYNLFIYDVLTTLNFQLTAQDREPIFVGYWSN